MAKARIAEVQLTLVLFPQLEDSLLMILHFRHWKSLKSSLQALLIRFQSVKGKGNFEQFLASLSLFGFSLFMLPLSRFWLIGYNLLYLVTPNAEENKEDAQDTINSTSCL